MIDLDQLCAAALKDHRDPLSGEMSDCGEEQAEIDALQVMCRALGHAGSTAWKDWAENDAVQFWLAEHSKFDLACCAERAGVKLGLSLWMQGAGTLRQLGKI